MALSNGSGAAETEGSATAGASTTARETPRETPRAKPKPKKAPEKRAKEQSTIGFPYRDLETAVSVAQAMLQAGGVALTPEQLGGVMGLQAGGGNFVSKVATARMFGLINTNQGKYELTLLGFSIVDSDEKRQKQARAEAFLSVPLYKRTYEEFKGKQLPPRPGLEQAFVRFGVAPKQKTAARLAFDKSAAQAGFLGPGQDRLIEPIIPNSTRPVAYVDEINLRDPDEQAAVPPNPFESLGRHPFIQGLLQTLPEPGTNWAVEGRTKWLQAAARCFDLIYKGSGEIDITPKPAPDEQK